MELSTCSVRTVVAAWILAIFAPSSTYAQAKLETVTLGQVTSTSLTFAPIFAAEELGFFAGEGIQLRHLNFKGGAVLQPQIANKQVTFGFTAVELAILSRQPGRDPIPIVFFYNGARESIWETVVLDNSPIRSVEDLKGKKIGIGATSNANVPLTRAMLRDLGMEMGKDYTFLPIGVGAPAFRAVLDGEVDAYNTFDSNIATFETTGTKLRRLPLAEKYRNLFSNGFAAHQDTIRDRPELVIGFGRALTKGIIVCETNPVFCVKNFWKHNPSLKPGTQSEEEALNAGLHIMQARLRKYTYFPDGAERKFGVYSEKAWRDYVDVLFEGGELATREIDVEPIYTNKFVPEFNKFDVKALQEQARALN